MDRHFQNLIDAVGVATDERSIRNAIRNFTLSCGFERYAYLQVHATETAALTDYPAGWQQEYFDNHYVAIDPVVTTAKRKFQMFTWSAEDRAARQGTRAIRKFYADAVDFGIRSGLSIPISTTFGRTAMLTFATDRRKVELPTLRDPMRAALAVAFIHVHLRLVDTASLTMSEVALSTQEATCLSWSSRGKSMKDIADLLDIRPRTVQFYLNNARDKLDARSLQQAVRIAMERKLI